jgi:hypothetical protein
MMFWLARSGHKMIMTLLAKGDLPSSRKIRGQ